MYEDHWKKILEAWRNELEASLDLSNAVRIHLVAEEKGKGEIHRFVAIGASKTKRRIGHYTNDQPVGRSKTR